MKKIILGSMALAMLALSSCGSQCSDNTNQTNNQSQCQKTEQVPQTEQVQQMTAEQLNEVEKVIMARRSIRKYKNLPVEDEKLQKVIQCGINAPNGMYLQSWEVRVVNTPELMQEINEGYAQYLKKNKRRPNHASYGAPVLIFIAYDKSYDLSQVDCGLLGENMILAAESIGLGTCCLGGIARFMETEEAAGLLKRLELPDSHKLLYAISLGYADEAPKAKPRTMDKVRFVK